jgi:transcriptional regulator with XRE-family HTH domain
MQLNRHALRVVRERSGLSVSALARLAGISQPHLSNIESGSRGASPATVVALAGALGGPLVALITPDDHHQRPAVKCGRCGHG